MKKIATIPHLSADAVKRIEKTARDFVGTVFEPNSTTDTPDIGFTDDIGRSAVLTAILDRITGTDGESKLSARIPCESYTPFAMAPGSEHHTFKIQHVSRSTGDLSTVLASTPGAKEAFDLAVMCSSCELLCQMTNTSSFSEALKLLKPIVATVYSSGFLTSSEKRCVDRLIDTIPGKVSKPIPDENVVEVVPGYEDSVISDPVIGWSVTSKFGVPRTFNGVTQPHEGVDLVSSRQDFTVHAPTPLVIRHVVLPNRDSHKQYYNPRHPPGDVDERWTSYIVADSVSFPHVRYVFMHVSPSSRVHTIMKSMTKTTETRGTSIREMYTATTTSAKIILPSNTVIATYGKYGATTGAHLHFEVHLKLPGQEWSSPVLGTTAGKSNYETAVDPVTWLKQIKTTRNYAYEKLMQAKYAVGDSGESFSLLEIFENAVERVITRASSAAVHVTSYDYSTSIENISIAAQPGSCKYVPLEGETAPVVQSTSGRLVNVSVSFVITDPLELARLVLTFKTSTRDDIMLSMLIHARSAFKATGGRKRMQYIYDAVTRKHLDKIVGMITSESQSHLRLDEPVRIENEILNSLGLTTFFPVDISVRTSSGIVNGYDVTLRLQYVNLGYRGTESLKKLKNGSQAPILPLGIKSFRGSTDDSTDDVLDLVGSFCSLSVKHTLAELVPVYIISRINDIVTALEQLSDNGTREVNLNQVSDLVRLTVPGNMAASVNDHIETMRDWSRSGKSAAEIFQSGRSVASGLTGSLPLCLSKAKVGVKLGKLGGLLAGAATIVGSLSIHLGSIFFATDTDSQKVFDTLSFNIPALVPIMMYEFLRDYIEQHRVGTEDEWIKTFVTNAAHFLGQTTSQSDVAEDDYEFRRTIPLKTPVTVSFTESARKRTVFTKVLLTYYVTGVHQENKYVNSTGILGAVSDAKTVVEQVTARLRQYGCTELRGNISSDNVVRLSIASACMINQYAMDVILSLYNMPNPASSADANGPIGTIEMAALRLREKASLRTHCLETIKAIISGSMLDTLAASTLLGNPATMLNDIREKALRSADQTDQDVSLLSAAVSHVLAERGDRMLSAKQYTQALGTNAVPILQGMFVDNSYSSPVLRQGYADALATSFMLVEQIGMGTVTQIGTIQFDIPTVPAIMETMSATFGENFHRMTTNLVGSAIETFVELVVPIVLIVVSVLATMYTGSGGAIVARIATWFSNALTVFEIVRYAVDAIFGDGLKYVVHSSQAILMGEWLAQRAREALNVENYLELCYTTGIWVPSLLTYSTDARDDQESSFVDYPVVKAGNVDLPPDCFIYKIGMAANSYAELLGIIDDSMAIAAEHYSKIDGSDFDTMLTELMDQLKGVAKDVIANTESKLQTMFRYWIDGAAAFIATPGSQTLPPAVAAARKAQPALFTQLMTEYTKLPEFVSYLLSDNGDSLFALYIRGTSPNGALSMNGGVDATTNLFKIEIDVDHGMLTLTGLKNQPGDYKVAGVAVPRATYARAGAYARPPENANTSYIVRFATDLGNLITKFTTMSATTLTALSGIVPNTLSYASLVRSLVGSSLRAVGSAGISNFREQLTNIGFDTIRKAVHFSSGYIYPTIKVYFIDEDNENFYLFDDLYSYASIVSIAVHMDRTSPVQTAMLQVTNMKGYLNDIVSDSMNLEANFIKGADENAPINSLMLRPGCKIKIQAGNTPVLTEENTVFTGRISTVTFGDITRIEATSHGAVLLEELSPGQVVVFGKEESLTRGAFETMFSYLKERVGSFLFGEYAKPVLSIKGIISHVMSKLLTTSGQLDDFALSSPFSVEADDEFEVTADTISTYLYMKYLPARIGALGDQHGIKTAISANKQLFENIHIADAPSAADRWGIPVRLSEIAWISRDETAWDILNEINLLLPNMMLTVRPLDTRGTVVWGDADGYYRYRRSADIETIGATLCASKLVNILGGSKMPVEVLINYVISGLTSGNDTRVEGAYAILTVIAYFASRYKSAMTEKEKRSAHDRLNVELTKDGDHGASLSSALKWFFDEVEPHKYDHSVFVTCLNDFKSKLREVHDAIGEVCSKNETSVGNTTIREISDQMSLVGESSEPLIRFVMAIEDAGDEIFRYITKTTMGMSRAHRKISDFHVKISGRDIVRNELALNAPFNTVCIQYPPEAGKAETIVEEAMYPKANSMMQTIPVHHSLEPWNWKVYSTYFKNANALPFSRSSTLSMATSSVLANLMKETYGGSITLLGDPSIRENDRILLWDENTDQFGIVGVRSHTFMFSHQDGCISVIEPDMQTRSSYNLHANGVDTVAWYLSFAVKTAITIAGLWTAYALGKKGLRIAKAKGRLKWIKLPEPLKRVMSRISTGRASMSNRFKSIKSIIPQNRLSRTLSTVKDKAADKVFSRQLGDQFLFSTDGKVVSLRDSVSREFLKVKELLEGHFVTDDALIKGCARYLDDVTRSIVKGETPALPGTNKASELLRSAWDMTLKDLRESTASVSSVGLRELFASKLREQMSQYLSHAHGTSFTDKALSSFAKTFLGTGTKESSGVIKKTITTGEKALPVDDLLAQSKTTARATAVTGELTKDVAADYEAGVDAMYRVIILGDWMLKDLLASSARVLGALFTLDFGISSVRELGEMWLVNTECQDNVVIAPMFFRGEPMVAGLEGVTKEEGIKYGLGDIIQGRFSSVMKGVYHSLSDPVAQSVYKFLRERAQVEYLADTPKRDVK